jgi:hypothetical protein
MPVSSDGIALGPITAGQSDISVWLRRAVSGVAWSRCHLVCHWLQISSIRNTGSLALLTKARMTNEPAVITGISEHALPPPVKVVHRASYGLGLVSVARLGGYYSHCGRRRLHIDQIVPQPDCAVVAAWRESTND